MLLLAMAFSIPVSGRADFSKTTIQSPDGRNSIVLQAADDHVDHLRFTISRDEHRLIGPSPLGPVLDVGGPLGKVPGSSAVRRGKVDENFQLPWGKTKTVANRCSFAVVTLSSAVKPSMGSRASRV